MPKTPNLKVFGLSNSLLFILKIVIYTWA
jgi:hypothetical protein